MTSGVPYVRIIDEPGGRLRRWLLFIVLRATAKRMRVHGNEIARMRDDQAWLDARLGADAPALERARASEGDVNGEWLAPAGLEHQERVILFMHGGAFLFRYPLTHAAMVAPWCNALRARVFAVDYRLAPEHPFPAAADDCHAAYRYLLRQGIQPRNIVIAGDSAGGNLALSTLHAIAAAGDPMPACAVALSPVVDLTLSGATFVTHESRDPVFSLTALIGLRNLYVQPQQVIDPRASPLFASFAGFPPLLIQTGSEEVLLDDSMRAAARAHREGVAVELEIWQRMPHLFQAARMLPQAASAAARIIDFIARHTGWTAADPPPPLGGAAYEAHA